MGRRRIVSNYYYDDTYERMGEAIGNLIGSKWSSNEAAYIQSRKDGYDSVDKWKAGGYKPLSGSATDIANQTARGNVDSSSSPVNTVPTEESPALKKYMLQNQDNTFIDTPDTSPQIGEYVNKFMPTLNANLNNSNNKPLGSSGTMRDLFVDGTKNYLTGNGSWKNPWGLR